MSQVVDRVLQSMKGTLKNVDYELLHPRRLQLAGAQ